MLERLSIRGFALIEELQINFTDHFNVLTGETGAGKSIVIDAVSVLLGGRGQSEYIRTGCEKAFLEGVFLYPSEHPVVSLLQALGIEEEEHTLVLSRELLLNGRNTCRINGRTVSLNQYRSIGLVLVDIHGQHDHQSLLQSDKHLGILDQFGGPAHEALVKQVKESFGAWQAVQKEMFLLQTREHDRLQRIDFLNYQVTEIQEAKLKPGDLEDLSREVHLLAHAEKINYALSLSYRQLFAGESGLSAYDCLSKALVALNDIKKVDPFLEKLTEQLESALYVLEETAGEIRDYQEQVEVSPARLEHAEKRLQELKDLCKKYGPTIEAVLAYQETAHIELQQWEHAEERAAQLEKQTASAWQAYEHVARTLSEERKRLALALEDKVVRELAELAMPAVKFKVSLSEGSSSATGQDQAEFLISPNPGEPLLPVAKIASGGELSRIMLAIKTIFADKDGIGTLIFDEIDAGIGGKAAQKVGEKLEKISSSQQVICVTHSPLISALADSHLLLTKEVEAGRTRTKVTYLNRQQRVEELSRMLGGEHSSQDLVKHAAQMIKN